MITTQQQHKKEDDRMKVIWKKAGQPPYEAEMENSLEALQAAVGGPCETVSLTEDLCIVCNEEGRLRRLPYNCSIGGLGLVGDILLVGVNGEEFDDIPGDAEDICRVVFAKWRRGIRS